MHTVTSEIVVEAPLEQVYNQWTQFEEFPRFMEAVAEVQQLSDSRLRWRAKFLGEEVEWEAEIDQQVPDTSIEWHSISGRPNRGLVQFVPWDMDETRVTLEMQYELEGIVESAANAVGLIGREVENDLKRFKEYIESRGTETGAWRGEITDPDQPDERAIAEERQPRPAVGSAPGGAPLVDERSGDLQA